MVKTLLVVAAMEDLITCQMDVSYAFLNEDLLEDVYMKLPQDTLIMAVEFPKMLPVSIILPLVPC